MAYEMVIQNRCFDELNDHETLSINGGGFLIPALIGAGVALVGNEIVERTTGKSIVTHIGEGLQTIGGGIKWVGDKLSQ